MKDRKTIEKLLQDLELPESSQILFHKELLKFLEDQAADKGGLRGSIPFEQADIEKYATSFLEQPPLIGYWTKHGEYRKNGVSWHSWFEYKRGELKRTLIELVTILIRNIETSEERKDPSYGDKLTKPILKSSKSIASYMKASKDQRDYNTKGIEKLKDTNHNNVRVAIPPAQSHSKVQLNLHSPLVIDDDDESGPTQDVPYRDDDDEELPDVTQIITPRKNRERLTTTGLSLNPDLTPPASKGKTPIRPWENARGAVESSKSSSSYLISPVLSHRQTIHTPVSGQKRNHDEENNEVQLDHTSPSVGPSARKKRNIQSMTTIEQLPEGSKNSPDGRSSLSPSPLQNPIQIPDILTANMSEFIKSAPVTSVHASRPTTPVPPADPVYNTIEPIPDIAPSNPQSATSEADHTIAASPPPNSTIRPTIHPAALEMGCNILNYFLACRKKRLRAANRLPAGTKSAARLHQDALLLDTVCSDISSRLDTYSSGGGRGDGGDGDGLGHGDSEQITHFTLHF